LPRTKTILEQIAANKKPCYDALESADKAFESGGIDVSNLEKLLDTMLAAQPVSALHQATGKVNTSCQSAHAGTSTRSATPAGGDGSA
jgi:hypothetical protein